MTFSGRKSRPVPEAIPGIYLKAPFTKHLAAVHMFLQLPAVSRLLEQVTVNQKAQAVCLGINKPTELDLSLFRITFVK